EYFFLHEAGGQDFEGHLYVLNRHSLRHTPSLKYISERETAEGCLLHAVVYTLRQIEVHVLEAAELTRERVLSRCDLRLHVEGLLKRLGVGVLGSFGLRNEGFLEQSLAVPIRCPLLSRGPVVIRQASIEDRSTTAIVQILEDDRGIRRTPRKLH